MVADVPVGVWHWHSAGELPALCQRLVLRTSPVGPRVVVSTTAFHARVRGSVPSLGGLKETKLFLPHPRVKVSIVGSLRDREVACSASDRQGSNFESCDWRTVSSQSSHHPQEVLLAQFSLYVHKDGLKPDSFYFLPPPWRAAFQKHHAHFRVARIEAAFNKAFCGSPLYPLSKRYIYFNRCKTCNCNMNICIWIWSTVLYHNFFF